MPCFLRSRPHPTAESLIFCSLSLCHTLHVLPPSDILFYLPCILKVKPTHILFYFHLFCKLFFMLIHNFSVVNNPFPFQSQEIVNPASSPFLFLQQRNCLHHSLCNQPMACCAEMNSVQTEKFAPCFFCRKAVRTSNPGAREDGTFFCCCQIQEIDKAPCQRQGAFLFHCSRNRAKKSFVLCILGLPNSS